MRLAATLTITRRAQSMCPGAPSGSGLNTMHLVDAETAQWVAAEQVLARLAPPAGDEFVITSSLRVSSTWVVTYNSRAFVQNGDIRRSLASNGPILVSDNHVVEQAGTDRSIEELVEDFERRLQ